MNRQSSGSLDLTSATSIVVASMIGAGVYTTSGFSLAVADSPVTVVWQWVVGGLIATCGAIGYAGLASRITDSGGEYVFLSRTLHPSAGIVAGWVSVLAGFTGPIAVAALTAETYLFGGHENPLGLPSGLIASGLIALAAAMHAFSLRGGARIQDLFVTLKMIVLLTIVFVAFTMDPLLWQGQSTSGQELAFSWSTFVGSLVYVSFSYAGFNAAIYISGEVQDPSINVPRAIILGTMLVTVLYVALNAVFVLLPPREQVSGRQDIAMAAVDHLERPWLSTTTRIVIVGSLMTSVSALVMTGPRVYAQMAADGYLPRWFRMASQGGARDTIPVTAILLQAIAAIFVVHIAKLQELLGYLGLTLMLSSALTVSTLYRLPKGNRPGLNRFCRLSATAFVAATMVISVVHAMDRPYEALIAALTFATGLIAYWCSRISNQGKAGR